MSNVEEDEEDDYLSAKFITEPSGSSSSSKRKRGLDLTYSERRKEAARISAEKQAANRKKSKREVLEEGLSTNLIERAIEEEGDWRISSAFKRQRTDDDDAPQNEGEAVDDAPKNKALAMMKKMGFKPGQALGKADKSGDVAGGSGLVEPLPLSLWEGRQGLGRAPRKFEAAPSKRFNADGVQVNDVDHEKARDEFRSRQRSEFLEKRDFGRLIRARKTLVNLDEKNGVEFNVLWTDPTDPETIPEDLRERLEQEALLAIQKSNSANKGEAARLKAQMAADALRPISAEDEDEEETERAPPAARTSKSKRPSQMFDDATLLDVQDWLKLNTSDRLKFTVEELRLKYFYCYWCGAQYENAEELQAECPGESEEAHD